MARGFKVWTFCSVYLTEIEIWWEVKLNHSSAKSSLLLTWSVFKYRDNYVLGAPFIGLHLVVLPGSMPFVHKPDPLT